MKHLIIHSICSVLSVAFLFVSGVLIAQDESVFSGDSLVDEPFLDQWTATVWGQHRSNTLDNKWTNILFRGGLIERDLVESALGNQKAEMGAFGLSAGSILKWSSNRFWKDTDVRICGSIQGRSLVDARWTPELFELVFTGNQNHLGRRDVLDGSQLRTTLWGTATVGLEGQNSNRIELGLAYRKSKIEGQIHTGYFRVNAGVDSLYAVLQAEGSIDTRAGWGLALNGEWHFTREEAPFALHVHVQNWGWVVVPGGGARYAVDTLFETTGLALDGPGWSLESLQSAGFVQDYLDIDTAGVTLQRLPGRCDVAIEYPLGPRSGWDVTLQMGEWMPLPRVMMGYRRAFGKQWQAGIQGVVGGWGRFRPAAWVRWRVPNERALTLFVEDPWGWGSSSAFGRGLTLRFEGL
ncbi:MAG: hypothetical protein OSA78_05475 [Flavobacteriales bacterium]|nr:hypothetical protein [Flavobacteriales bacterium]